MAWNPFKAVGNAVKGLFGGREAAAPEAPVTLQQPEPVRAPEPARQPEPQRAPEPQQSERGFFGRLADRITGRGERERELQERERQLAERERQVEQKERQVEEKARQAEPRPTEAKEPRPTEAKEPRPTEAKPVEEPKPAPEVRDLVREAMERDQQARQEESDRRERQRQESIQKEQERQAARAEERQKQADAILGKYKPVQPLGDKGRLGAIYTSSSGEEIMRRLETAAAVDHRVTLRILKSDGTWTELFRETGRRAGRGIQASHLLNLIKNNANGDLDAWIAGGCTGIEGSYEDDLLDDAVGYQLVETY